MHTRDRWRDKEDIKTDGEIEKSSDRLADKEVGIPTGVQPSIQTEKHTGIEAYR